jgi:hypothetical protein
MPLLISCCSFSKTGVLELTVDSTSAKSSKARLYVDGEFIGNPRMPITELYLREGRHEIKIELNNCGSYKEYVTVMGDNSCQALNIVIKRKSVFESDLDNMEYYIVDMNDLDECSDYLNGKNVLIQGDYAVGFETSKLNDVIWIEPLSDVKFVNAPQKVEQYEPFKVKVYGELSSLLGAYGHLDKYKYSITPHKIIFIKSKD